VRRSCGSSKVTYLDRDRAVEQLRQCARALAARDAAVVEVRLFGSLARMEAVPGSDADILIVLRHHALSRWFDRIPEYQAAFADMDMPVEVFPYTQDELTRLDSGATGLAGAARSGLLLTK